MTCLKSTFTASRLEFHDHVPEVATYTLTGSFSKNITNNATLSFSTHYGNNTEQEGDTVEFCGSMDSIDQPDPNRKQDCPPEKGFALIMMSAWVMPMFFVPVSLACTDRWDPRCLLG